MRRKKLMVYGFIMQKNLKKLQISLIGMLVFHVCLCRVIKNVGWLFATNVNVYFCKIKFAGFLLHTQRSLQIRQCLQYYYEKTNAIVNKHEEL